MLLQLMFMSKCTSRIFGKKMIDRQVSNGNYFLKYNKSSLTYHVMA